MNAVDVSTDGENKHFVLKAILIWCIHNYPTYGLVSGQVTKGYKRCTKCGPDVSTRQSTALDKNLYLGHQRYLTRNHPYRRLQRAFDGKEENRALPCPLTGRNIVRHANTREKWLNAFNENRHGGGQRSSAHNWSEEVVRLVSSSVLACQCTIAISIPYTNLHYFSYLIVKHYM